MEKLLVMDFIVDKPIIPTPKNCAELILVKEIAWAIFTTSFKIILLSLVTRIILKVSKITRD